MKKKTLILLSAIVSAIVVASLFFCAKKHVTEPVTAFLEESEIPDESLILPAPPEKDSPAFINDRFWYDWGKEQRKDSLRASQASFDCFHLEYDQIGECFSEAFGMEISTQNTPEITELLKGVMPNIKQSFKNAKDTYKRTRPFEEFGEKSLIEERGEEEKYRNTYSYPSGHTMRAYITASLLSEINPDATDKLMQRARVFAENRLVCGHHYKSDVDASIILSTALLARLHSDKEFKAQLKKARKEFKHKKSRM